MLPVCIPLAGGSGSLSNARLGPSEPAPGCVRPLWSDRPRCERTAAGVARHPQAALCMAEYCARQLISARPTCGTGTIAPPCRLTAPPHSRMAGAWEQQQQPSKPGGRVTSTRGRKEASTEISLRLAARSDGGSLPQTPNPHSRQSRHRPHAQTGHFATDFFRTLVVRAI